MQLPLMANQLATLGNGAAVVGNQQQPQPQQMPQDNPGILQAQLMQQEQQRKLADSLMKQGYIPNSGGLGALAMVASAWKGKKMAKDADEKIADATKRLFEAQNAEEQRKAAAALQAEIDKENRKFKQDAAMKGIEHGYKEAETPTDIKELRMLREDPALAQHDLTRRRASASSTNISVPGEKYVAPFEKALAEADVGMYNDMRKEAMAARQAQMSADQLKTVLDGMPSGNPRMFYSQMAAQLGAPAGADYQTQKALVEDQVNAILNAAKGPQTDQDAARARAQIPNMATNPKAREVIFDYIRRKNVEKIETFKKTDAQFRQGGNLWQNETDTTIPTTPKPNAPPKAGEVQNGYRYKGGDPAKPSSWVKM